MPRTPMGDSDTLPYFSRRATCSNCGRVIVYRRSVLGGRQWAHEGRGTQCPQPPPKFATPKDGTVEDLT